MYREIELYGELTHEQKAFIIYSNMFEEISFLPHDVKLLDVNINDTLLILNVSREIKNYGGNAAEHALVKMLQRNAWQIYGVGMLTLLIDSRLDCLPEGTMLRERCILHLSN
jgi:hypothetical protein